VALAVLSQAKGDVPATLFPGQDGDLSVKISNSNTGAIQITSVALSGTITLDVGGGHCDSSFVTWNGTQGGNFGSVAAGATTVITVPGAVHLAANAPTTCQDCWPRSQSKENRNRPKATSHQGLSPCWTMPSAFSQGAAPSSLRQNV
jgi:hypothetical protein